MANDLLPSRAAHALFGPNAFEEVDDAERQRDLRTDDGEPALLVFGKASQSLYVVGGHGEGSREPGYAGVSGRSYHLTDESAARQLPGERVLSASAPDDEDPHDPSWLLLRHALLGRRIASR